MENRKATNPSITTLSLLTLIVGTEIGSSIVSINTTRSKISTCQKRESEEKASESQNGELKFGLDLETCDLIVDGN